MSRPTELLEGFSGLTANRLVLALDYDGTLVPIRERPEEATPDEDLLDLLRSLADRPDLVVVVLSGRAVAVLADWLPVRGLVLVGTHGAEWRPRAGAAVPLLAPPDARRIARDVADSLEHALSSIPGSQVERKAYGVCAHYRRVREEDRGLFVSRFEAATGRFDERVVVTPGKCVMDVGFPGVTKGRGLAAAREALGVGEDPVLALGDDTTDETTFRSLGERDLTIRVGEGESAARHRLPDPEAARALLRDLLARRG